MYHGVPYRSPWGGLKFSLPLLVCIPTPDMVLDISLITRDTREDLGMELRSDVLIFSLFLEDLTSLILPMILRIDKEKSVLFGHTSRALSFDQKVLLLIELGSLNEEHRTRFLWLQQIRNQLMHNKKAVSMVECLKYTSVKEKELLDSFDTDEDATKEEQLTQALQTLCHYVTTASVEIVLDASDRVMKAIPTKYRGKFDFKKEKEAFTELARSWKKEKPK